MFAGEGFNCADKRTLMQVAHSNAFKRTNGVCKHITKVHIFRKKANNYELLQTNVANAWNNIGAAEIINNIHHANF